MLYVGRLHNGDETRVQTHDCCAALAGRVQRIARPSLASGATAVRGMVEPAVGRKRSIASTTDAQLFVLLVAAGAS